MNGTLHITINLNFNPGDDYHYGDDGDGDTINLNFDRGNNDRYHHNYGCDDDVTTDNFMAKESVQIQNLLNIILVRDDEASG